MGGVIGIRREDKGKWERRVPLTPVKLQGLRQEHGIESYVQPSPVRIFREEEFAGAGAVVQEDLSAAPLVFGVKEIPSHLFLPGRTYVFFAHVVKGQPHNMPMLRRMMELGCNLIDYEKVTDERGRRLIFFGWHAGVVAMIESLWALGKRLRAEGVPNPFDHLRNTYTYERLEAARADVRKAGELIASRGLPEAVSPLIIGVAGYGNVGRGVQEILGDLPTSEIAPDQVARVASDPAASRHLVYKVTFKEEHLVAPLRPDQPFALDHYYQHPEEFSSRMAQFLPHLSLLMNCIYWDSRYPRILTREIAGSLWGNGRTPRLRIVGDATCDLHGAIECTVKVTDPGDPVYVYDPATGEAHMGVAGHGPVVLAVDILPSELPREASEYFSEVLAPFVPAMARTDFSAPLERIDLPAPIRRALVLHRGELTPEFKYIKRYLDPDHS